MRRTVFTLVIGLVVIAGPFAALPVRFEAGKKDGERLKRLFDRPIESVRPLPGLSAQPRARLVARTGLSRSALPTVRLYVVLLEGESVPARTALLDAPWKGKTARIGYAATSRGGPGGSGGPRAFDEYGKPLTDLDPFLSQFRGAEALRLTEGSSRPIGEIIQLREEALTQSKPPPKRSLRARWVLIRHHLLMFEAQRLLENLRRAAREQRPLQQSVTELVDHTVRMNQFATHLKAVMKPKEVGQYRRFMATGEAEAAGVSELLNAGEVEKARERVAKQVGRACVECHEWKQNQWQQPLREALLHELDGVGLRSGSFVVGVDVRPFGLDADRAQELAGAVKAVMLLAHDVGK